MKLSTRMTLISLGITLITALVVVLIFNSNNTREYRTVEEHVFEKRIQEKAIFLENSLLDMELFVHDWAYWDYIYAYINGENDSFIDENMTEESYLNYGMDYFAVYDETMQVVYDAKFNRQEGRLDAIQPKILNIFRDVGYATGVMDIDGQWIVYSGSPINTTKGNNKPEGLLVFAYDLTADILRRTGRIINPELERAIVGKDHRDDGYIVVTSKEDSAYDIESGFAHTDDAVSKAYIYYPVLNKNEELEMSFVMNNSIQALGKKHIMEKTILITLAMVLLGGVLTWVVRYMLISRIVNLEAQMYGITAKGSVDERIVERHNDELGRISRSINTMLDELESVHNEIKYLAEHDELTGALTRRTGLNMLEKGISQSRKSNQVLTIAYMDIDGLKVINDSYGHVEGDTLIKTVAHCIMESLGDKGTMVRMGGDEFMVIFQEITSDRATAIMEESRRMLNRREAELEAEYTMSFSYGITSYNGEDDADSFVELADTSMYRQRARDR